jgi:hypothetical protein
MHPLDPLTSGEIIQVATLLKAQGSGESLHFKAVRISNFPTSAYRKHRNIRYNCLRVYKTVQLIYLIDIIRNFAKPSKLGFESCLKR